MLTQRFPESVYQNGTVAKVQLSDQGLWPEAVASALAPRAGEVNLASRGFEVSLASRGFELNSQVQLVTEKPHQAIPEGWVPVPELYLPPRYQVEAEGQLRIVMLGAESSGKSSLALALARHFQAPLLLEYVRRWLDWGAGPAEASDMAPIAMVQRAAEQALAQRYSGLLLQDTGLLTIACWSQVLFGHQPAWLDRALADWQADLVLVCAPDLPWEYDPQRCQHSLLEREQFTRMTIDWLNQLQLPWQLIAGQGECRIEAAIAAVNQRQLLR